MICAVAIPVPSPHLCLRRTTPHLQAESAQQAAALVAARHSLRAARSRLQRMQSVLEDL